MKRIILLLYSIIIPFVCFSQSEIGLYFGSDIDSIYSVVKERYGETSLYGMHGGNNIDYPAAKVDSFICIDKNIYIFDKQQKTAKTTLLAFQRNSRGILVLSQIVFLIGDIPKNDGVLLTKVQESYLEYVKQNYPNDYQEFFNDEFFICMRFGKAKYTGGTWYGLYNVIERPQAYRILLIFTVPQI